MFSNSKDNLNCINGLKGFGACMIAFVWHYQHFAPQAGSPFYILFTPFYDMGDRMVEVFFMLSGLGMVLGYEKRIQNDTITFVEYMGKRVKKLFPLMWITLFITLCLQCIYYYKTGTTFVYPNLDIYHFLLNLLGLQNGVLELQSSYNSPSWYISVLVWCYILFFCIVRKTNIEDDLLVFKYILIVLLGSVVLLTGFNFPILNSLMGRGFSCFFLGAVLAKIYQKREKLYSCRIGGVCLVFLVVTRILIKYCGYGILGNLQMAVILGIAPALILSVLFVPIINKIFAFKPLVYLGKLSLSIYLWHFPIQCIWKIIDVYLELEINYSNRGIWLSYAASVLVLSALYERFVASKVQEIGKVFLREVS